MCCNPNYYDESNPILGVVLAGGKSSRMGSDKGLLLKHEQQWFKLVAEKLERFGIPVVISINASQEGDYQRYYDKEYLVKDKIGLEGPLEGILSVHDKFPSHDLIVVAADLPDLTFSTIKDLVDIYSEKSGEHDFFVYSIAEQLEPLLGVYTAEGLGKVFSLHLSGQLEKKSMKYLLELGNTFSFELAQSKINELKNYNYKEQL